MFEILLVVFFIYLSGIAYLVMEDISFYDTRKQYELDKLNEQRMKLHMNPLYLNDFKYSKQKLKTKELLMSWVTWSTIRKAHMNYKIRYGIKV